MADDRMGLKRAYGDDGVHPNMTGYRVMVPLVESAIREALRQSIDAEPHFPGAST